MKKIAFFFMLLGLLELACEKEISRTVKEEEQPQVIIDVTETDDSTEDDEGLSQIEKNDYSVYTFGGVRGTYFGCVSNFIGKKEETFAITLGTNLTHNTFFSQKEFEMLIHAGERQFGSLGSFSSFPVIDSGLVEIALTDKHSRKWCTTQIIEKYSDHGEHANVKVEQKKSSFIIESIHKLEVGPEIEGYRIKGSFDCVLYEVNGKAKKRIKGKFSGIVAPK